MSEISEEVKKNFLNYSKSKLKVNKTIYKRDVGRLLEEIEKIQKEKDTLVEELEKSNSLHRVEEVVAKKLRDKVSKLAENEKELKELVKEIPDLEDRISELLKEKRNLELQLSLEKSRGIISQIRNRIQTFFSRG